MTPCLPLSAYAIDPSLLPFRTSVDNYHAGTGISDHIERDFPTTVTDMTKYSIVPVGSWGMMSESFRREELSARILEESSVPKSINIIDIETGKQAKGRKSGFLATSPLRPSKN